jgi:hypothetical protein
MLFKILKTFNTFGTDEKDKTLYCKVMAMLRIKVLKKSGFLTRVKLGVESVRQCFYANSDPDPDQTSTWRFGSASKRCQSITLIVMIPITLFTIICVVSLPSWRKIVLFNFMYLQHYYSLFNNHFCRKRMSVIVKTPWGKNLLVTKGAESSVIPRYL